MRSLTTAVLVAAFVLVAVSAQAQQKPDPNGTWKWSMTYNNQTREVTLKLKLDGDKLTGTISGRSGDTAISDASYKDGEVSFKVVRERDGRKMTTKYTGKVTDDTIKGKAEYERDGKPQSRDWEAKRAKS